MANVLVQFEVDENIREEVIDICNQLGIDLPAYLRMCMTRLVAEKGIPFGMYLEDAGLNGGAAAMKQASENAKAKGIADMTLEEINAEVSAVRK